MNKSEHTHSHTPCRLLQRLCIYSVLAFHLLPSCSFTRHLKSILNDYVLASPFFYSLYLILPSCSPPFGLVAQRWIVKSLFFCFRFVSFSLPKLCCSAPPRLSRNRYVTQYDVCCCCSSWLVSRWGDKQKNKTKKEVKRKDWDLGTQGILLKNHSLFFGFLQLEQWR